MRRWHPLILIVALLGLLGASGRDLEDHDELISDAALIQGQWKLSSAQSGGKSVGTDGNVIAVEGEDWQAGKFTFQFHLYPGDDPKQIDWDFNGQTWQGIYRLDGDELWLCLSTPGNPRPTKFKTQPGDGNKLHVRKRVSVDLAN